MLQSILACSLSMQEDCREDETTDVPLEERLSDLAWKGALKGPTEELAEALGDGSLTGRVPRWADA